MNYLHPQPDGIDVIINKIQSKTYENILAEWGQLDMFGRVHKKNNADEDLSLVRYKGSGEYEKVLFSEGNKIFFIQGNEPDIKLGVATNKLYVVAIVKLQGLDSINDEKEHIMLTSELTSVLGINAVTGLKYEMENVKRITGGSFQENNFKYSNIHPYHVFIVECEVNYSIGKNNC